MRLALALLLALVVLTPTRATAAVLITLPGVSCTAGTAGADVRLAAPVSTQDFCLDSTTSELNRYVTGLGWVRVTTAGAPISVLSTGAKGDGTTDDTSAFQAAITAAQVLGDEVYIPPALVRYLLASGVTYDVTKGPLTLRGAGKTITNVRYAGTGTWLSPTGSTTLNLSLTITDFTIQLSGAGGTALNLAQCISCTVRSVRIASGTGATNGVGIAANITNTAWTSFYNVIDDVTFDSLTTGILLDASVGQRANRWRILAPTVLGGTNGFVFTNVQGVDVVTPYFNEISGDGITFGASSDRAFVTGARLESAAGGALFNMNATANRTTIVGSAVHNGTIYRGGVPSGTRTYIFGTWDEGICWTGSTVTTLTCIDRQTDGGIQYNQPPIATLLANLGTPADGVMIYCSDCTFANPCAGGGTGAWAKRLAGAWRCD